MSGLTLFPQVHRKPYGESLRNPQNLRVEDPYEEEEDLMRRAAYPRGGGQLAVCRPLHGADVELLAPFSGIDKICGEAWGLVMVPPPQGPVPLLPAADGFLFRNTPASFECRRTVPPGPGGGGAMSTTRNQACSQRE